MFEHLVRTEGCIGRYHGKHTHLFVATLRVRYQNNVKDTYQLELKIGEANEDKDKIEHAK